MTRTLIVLCCSICLLTTMNAARNTLDRTKRPQGKPAPAVTLPDIQKSVLDNGLTIWLVERHQLPYVAFNLVVQAGSDHDNPAMPGVASMTADVIDEGTQTRNALQISDEFESVGASFGVGSSMDYSSATLGVLSKYLDKALGVYADVLLNPTFPQKEFDRLKKQRVTSLLQQKDQPVAIANNAFSRILYGSDHPYGNNPAGTEASLNAMTVEDLRRFYNDYYRPNNCVLIVVGDATMKDLKPRIAAAFAGWKPLDVNAVPVPSPPAMETRKVYLIDKPGAPQSEIRIGYPALRRNTPDYFPVLLMNRMLGGQFTSRINLNLRERHGYTYGARSSFNFQKGAGPFVASSGVVTEKTDRSIHEFLHEIDTMQKAGMSGEELAYARRGLIGGFALSFETAAQVSQALGAIAVYQLPGNYFSTYLPNVEKVTADDIVRVAGKYLQSSGMAIVVVGDLRKIRPGIEALGLGPVILCDIDGKPL